MGRPHRYLYWKNKKERDEDRRKAWETKREILEDGNQPGHVRLQASEQMLDRIDGKAAQVVELQGNADKPLAVKHELDWDDFARLYAAIGASQAGIDGNGTEKSVHSAYTNGAASLLLDPTT